MIRDQKGSWSTISSYDLLYLKIFFVQSVPPQLNLILSSFIMEILVRLKNRKYDIDTFFGGKYLKKSYI